MTAVNDALDGSFPYGHPKRGFVDMDFERLVYDMEDFHGARAPGIIVGARVRDTVLEEVRRTPDRAVAVETVTGLPDAVQGGCVILPYRQRPPEGL